MRSRVWVGALLTLLAAALLLPTAAVAKNKPADTVFKNGYVYTVNPGERVAQAVAVKDGKIVYVGANRGARAFVGAHTKVVDLGGKMMLPGFIDSHMHASMTVSSLYSVLLYGLTSVDEYTAAVADFVAANPDMDIIRGQGWSNTVVPDGGPLASSLDAVVGDKPVSIMSEDGHSYWVNSKALELAGITGATPDPEDGVIERLAGTKVSDPPYGTPSGTLRETAANLVTDLIPDYSVPEYKDGVDYFQYEVAGPAGLTTVFDPLMYAGSNGVQALEEMAAGGDLRVRFRAALAITPEDGLRDWIAVAKAERDSHTHGMFKVPAVKIFADGVVEGHTAYLDEPYADALEYKGDATYRGEPIWQLDQLKKTFARLDRAGFQIHTHAIGDAATTETLDALAYARKANGKHDWRPGITHIQLVDPKDFPRFARLGVTAVPDPYWFIKDDYYTYLQVPYLGQPRADLEYPMKSFFDAGVTVASASDYPVTIPPDPLAGIAVGVNRWDPTWVWEYPVADDLSHVLWPEERVSVKRMIRSFTLDGAKANFLEKRTGTIKVGKRADLVVLDTNLLEVADKAELFDAHVLFTMGSGEVLYDKLAD
jgi:predicted amidohydrolase YtcJ